MKSHEAYSLMIPRGRAGAAKVHALALGCSESLVNQWRRPSEDGLYDTGKRNAIDRLEVTMRTALGMQIPEHEALAGLHCLARMFNHVCVRIPLPDANLDDQTKDLLKAMKEVGEFAAATSSSLEDGTVSDAERKRVLKEGYEAMAAIMASLQHYKEGQ